MTDGYRRVEKYRPDTLEDVSGHQDILATINKFVDSNVSRQAWYEEGLKLIAVQRLPHLLLYGHRGPARHLQS
jgi:replication factor C subunit 3/5